MQSAKNYSTYLFDVGGTLITFAEWRRAQEYARRAGRVGVEVSDQTAFDILSALDLEIPERSRHLKLSLMPVEEQRAFWLDLWAEGFRQLGVPATDAVSFANELLDPVNGGNFQEVFEDVIPALDALVVRGKRLGIISNFSPNCEALLRGMGLADYFDFFIVSGIVRVEKPDPRIFELAIAAAGRDVSELVYVGDSIFHDVEGARSVGMDAILVDRANRFPNFEREFGSRRVRDLRELSKF